MAPMTIWMTSRKEESRWEQDDGDGPFYGFVPDRLPNLWMLLARIPERADVSRSSFVHYAMVDSFVLSVTSERDQK